jgi:hypothetical protein
MSPHCAIDHRFIQMDDVRLVVKARRDLYDSEIPEDHVPGGSLIAVVKLIAEGVTGQAHGSLRGRHFGRLIMALDRLGRPMWCSRLPVSDSIAFLGSVLTAPSS